MTATDLHVQQPSGARSFSWIGGILLGIVLASVALAAGICAFTGMSLYQFAQIFQGGQVHVGIDQLTVVRQIRALQRLETVSYAADKILTGERENPILPRFLAGDRLLMEAHGEVIAGLDLSKIQPADIQVRGRRVSVHLPEAEIFIARVDNEKTRVYSRDTGLFSSADPNLEGEVRAEAEREIRAAALHDGILKTAETNAGGTVNKMLISLGFASVEIR